MVERPILFNAAMVRATLEGRKTQARLPLRPQPPERYSEMYLDPGWLWSRSTSGEGGEQQDLWTIPPCPFGQPGDRLWVRETFASYRGCSERCSPGDASYVVLCDGTHKGARTYAPAKHYEPGAFDGIKWRPSIHMPRWASRITLEVTEVRVHRLQDISDDDCYADMPASRGRMPPWLEFADLWDSIYGKRAPWSSNPWVFACKFRRLAPSGQKESL